MIFYQKPLRAVFEFPGQQTKARHTKKHKKEKKNRKTGEIKSIREEIHSLVII